MNNKKEKKMSEGLFKCILCEKVCKGINGLKIHMEACVKKDPNKVIALQCTKCKIFMTTDPIEFIDHHMYCDGKTYAISSLQKRFREEEQEKLRDKFNKIVSIKCSFCGYLCKDLVDLAKHYKSCKKKPKGLGSGFDTRLLRKMLTPSLPSEIDFEYNANPTQVEKIMKGDLTAIRNEFIDKIEVVLSTLSKCKKCGEILEGAIEICNFCGEEIYQNVEWTQYQIKLAKSLMEEHLERFWRFYYIVDMELYIDSVVRVFEHAIMVNFKGVGKS